jgi:hypothetical protein
MELMFQRAGVENAFGEADEAATWSVRAIRKAEALGSEHTPRLPTVTGYELIGDGNTALVVSEVSRASDPARADRVIASIPSRQFLRDRR